MARYIFVTGGVVSSLGKGLSSASLAYLLQSRGYKVRLRKLDPYLNVDPGTMSPFQHGEVYVTDDGAETDLDLGHYERFSGVSSKKSEGGALGIGVSQENMMFSKSAGNFMTKATGVIATLFIICSLALTIVSRGDLTPSSSVLDQVEEDTPSIPENNN